MAAGLANGIAIPTDDTRAGKGDLGFGSDALRANADWADGVAAAAGAACWGAAVVAAEVTHDSLVRVVGHDSRAAAAFCRVATCPALHGLPRPTTIHKQDRLLTAREGIRHRLSEGAGEHAAIAVQQFLPQVDDFNVGEWAFSPSGVAAGGVRGDAAGEFKQRDIVAEGGVHRADVRRGAAEQDDGVFAAGALDCDLTRVVAGGGGFLLVGPFLLLIDDD